MFSVRLVYLVLWKVIRTEQSGRIKALLLRRINDYFGDAFRDASAAFCQAAAAAAVEEETAIPLLLRPFYFCQSEPNKT